MVFGVQLFTLRYFQGRFGELVEQVVQSAGEEDELSRGTARARRSR